MKSMNFTGVQGSGISLSETREIAPFQSIETNSIIDISVTFGETQSVTVTCDDNLLSMIETKVSENQLAIRTTGSLSTQVGIEIAIVMEKLVSARANGTGDIHIIGFRGEQLELTTDGTGDITADGTVKVIRATTDGIGEIQLENLIATEAYVETNGIGDITVHATSKVDARIDGIGNITIIGDPKDSKTQIDGLGDIIRN
jgi:hypothetical protein